MMLLRWGSLAVMAAIGAAANAVNQTTCSGRSYTYQEMAGFGFFAADARDQYGDTLGAISGISLDRNKWKKLADGSYSGVIWMSPDRGWASEGLVHTHSRIHSFTFKFTPKPNATVANPSGPNLSFEYQSTTLLYGPDGTTPCTGLDADAVGHLTFRGFPDLPVTTYPGDNVGGPPANSKLIPIDAEGLVVKKDGSFFISDEYGPYVYYFDKSGKMLSAIRPPDAFIPMRNGAESFSSDTTSRNGPNQAVIPANNPSGRRNNQGFEGLTVADDSKILYVMLQSAANQEGGSSIATRRYVRLLRYDITNPLSAKLTREVVVPLPLYTDPVDNKVKVAAQSEILHIQNGQFFVLARDSGKGYPLQNLQSVYRHADIIETGSATNILGSTYDCATCSIASAAGVLKTGIRPAAYCTFLDFNVNSQLQRFGLQNGAPPVGGDPSATSLSEQWESLAVAPLDGHKGDDDEWYLFSFNDNSYITQNGFISFGQETYQDPTGTNVFNTALVFKIKIPDNSNAFN